MQFEQSDAGSSVERLSEPMHIKYLIETVNISTLGQDDIEDVRMILQMHLARVNKVIEVIHEQVQQQRDDNNRFMMGL
jgi:hypothetical protein|tara:strand:- start:579 stop:812 length:234 start_codon:yes stop_codon:yes gene_type:complete